MSLLLSSVMGNSLFSKLIITSTRPWITPVYSGFLPISSFKIKKKQLSISLTANIACFGAFTLGIRNIEKLLDIYLSSEFEYGGASQPKVDKIRAYELAQS